jgi:hypothetical protein
MKCKSCKEDVPPKFAHAIATNMCPLCGQEIMDAKLQNILGELKIALGDAKDYMAEVEDWLFSNFSLRKIKENEIVVDKEANEKSKMQFENIQTEKTKRHVGNPGVMVNRNEQDEQVEDDIVVEDKPSTVFAKRAGVHNVKRAVDFIKGRSTGAADPSEFQGVDEEYGDIVEDHKDLNPLNNSERNQMANIFRNEDSKVLDELEMQKLKRLQSQGAINGGSGFFRRQS